MIVTWARRGDFFSGYHSAYQWNKIRRVILEGGGGEAVHVAQKFPQIIGPEGGGSLPWFVVGGRVGGGVVGGGQHAAEVCPGNVEGDGAIMHVKNFPVVAIVKVEWGAVGVHRGRGGELELGAAGKGE